jgi:two-component sensor histidine kinase
MEGVSLDKNSASPKELLPLSEIYIDHNHSLTIESIKNQRFSKITQRKLGFGYSPDIDVWIRFKLSNKSDKKINKIIEYANPLTSKIELFSEEKLLKRDGLLYFSIDRETLNPNFKITLNPHESKIFYIKAFSHITTLIIQLKLWDPKLFFKKEIKHQFILAMFFGAISIIILYNLLIYLSIKDRSYLYYVLFFMGITLHHLIYKGVMSLYLLPSDMMRYLIEFSSLIVAFPTFALALFTQSILNLKQYPRINKLLNFYLLISPLLILFIHELDITKYRNLPSIILLLLLFLITNYTLIKKNRQAYFIIAGWLLFLTSGLFMYLSSLGLYDIFSISPYYIEIALIVESLIFSFSLAERINQLNQEKIRLQNNLIDHQKQEQITLFRQVEQQTYKLKQSLEEKELLIKELNHRVKNSIQTIVAFLRLQIDEIEDKRVEDILKTLENRVMAISHLYALLYTKDHLSFVNTYEYFSAIIEDIESCYSPSSVHIDFDVAKHIKSEHAIYCGFILNEAITNAFQHAFIERKKGTISIQLKEKNHGDFKLIIKDNGVGYNKEEKRDTLGLTIIETLVVTQLKGSLEINTDHGVEIIVIWRENGDRED